MDKRYHNKGAFLTEIGKMIVIEEEHLDAVQDHHIREAIRNLLEIRLPVAPGKVLIRLECIGVCGSDVHYFQSGQCGTYHLELSRDIPYLLGHEASGTVVEVGAGVTDITVGDRVCCEPGIPCGKCEFCLSGRYNLCPDIVFWATPPVQGCNLRYVEFDARYCFKLNDKIDAATGAMIEPFAIGMFAVETAEIKANDSVLIMGCGSMGLMALIAARHKKAGSIIVCDIEDFRLQKAKELGADHIINNRLISEDELYNAIRDITNGGPHSVIETAGNKTTIRQAGELVRRGGTVVLVAMTGEGTIPFNMDAIKGKEAQIRPVFRYRDMFPKCISAVTNDIKCDIKKVISDYYSFDEIQKAYEDSVFRKNEIIKAAVIID